MSDSFHSADLEAYLDETLPPDAMAAIEKSLRSDESLIAQLVAIHARRDSGVHSVGEVWRRQRLTCPTREQLGGFLLEVLSEKVANYILFHLEAVGCRYCQANMADLRNQGAEATDNTATRRRKYFQSSAGYLK